MGQHAEDSIYHSEYNTSFNKTYTANNKISGIKKYIVKKYKLNIGTDTLCRIINLYGKQHHWSNNMMKQPLRQKIHGVSDGNFKPFIKWLNKDIICDIIASKELNK